MSQWFLRVNVFTQRHCVCCDDGVRMVSCSDDYRVYRAVHLVIHLAIVIIFLRVRETIEYGFRVFPVYVTKSDDILCFFYVLNIGVTHAANTDIRNIQFV